MSDLISGREALIAIANGKEVQIDMDGVWLCGDDFKATQIEFVLNDYYRFRIKPRTITLNGIEIPAPFEPKEGEGFWHISTENDKGYAWQHFESKSVDYSYIQFGAWQTEEEIKQVVEALRSVFK